MPSTKCLACRAHEGYATDAGQLRAGCHRTQDGCHSGIVAFAKTKDGSRGDAVSACELRSRCVLAPPREEIRSCGESDGRGGPITLDPLSFGCRRAAHRRQHADSPLELAIALARFIPIPHALENKPQMMRINRHRFVTSFANQFAVADVVRPGRYTIGRLDVRPAGEWLLGRVGDRCPLAVQTIGQIGLVVSTPIFFDDRQILVLPLESIGVAGLEDLGLEPRWRDRGSLAESLPVWSTGATSGRSDWSRRGRHVAYHR